jgi:hypothetical protein
MTEGKRLALARHSLFATYAVLTRLPAQTGQDVVRLLAGQLGA